LNASPCLQEEAFIFLNTYIYCLYRRLQREGVVKSRGAATPDGGLAKAVPNLIGYTVYLFLAVMFVVGK